jgi:4-amino-4-deoxy-L-arabinose transferase-like glycosyltransferase
VKNCDASAGPISLLVRHTNIYLVSLLAVIAVFYAATLRPGHIWADDYAMYVHHAQNIAEGRPYADTGYIYSPRVVISPRMYPPVFPLMLAPLYRIFGLNLMPMKMEEVVFFLLTLVTVWAFWQKELEAGYAIALVAILGFSPVFWAAKDNVLSDLPFLLFFYIAAGLVRWAPRDQKRWWLWAVLVGIFLYLGTGTRVAGIAMVAGLVFHDVVRYRKVTRLTGIALAVWLALVLFQYRFIGPAQGTYLEQGSPTAHTIVANILSYTRVTAAFWVASTRNAFSYGMLAIVAVLTGAGFCYQCRRGMTIVEAFLVPYAALIIIWPFPSGVRLVFPLIPWAVFLALSGLRGITARFAPRYSAAAVWLLLLITAIPYAIAYHNTDFGPIREDAGMPEFQQLCQQVREHTGPEDVLIYYRARALSLYTMRRASAYNARGTGRELWQYSQDIRARYVITSNAFHEDAGFLDRYVQNYSSNFDLIYENAVFRMYRIRPIAEARALAANR